MLGKWKKIKKITMISFLLATITFGVIGDITSVFAQGADEDEFDSQFFSGNDVFFWDPTYQNVCSADGGGLVGGSTKEKIWNFLIANDLSAEQAAGLMGNMQQESNFIPSNYQGTVEFDLWESGTSGRAWGLAQWDGGRRFTAPDKGILGTLRKEKPELAKEYTKFKYDTIGEPNEEFPAKDFDELILFQLDYMMQESISRPVTASGFPGSADKEWARMKEQPNLAKATEFWERNFEVAGRPNLPQRIGYAQAIFDEFKDNLSATGSGTAGCTGADGIQELALAYAWPEYHPPNYPQKKPAYEEAIQKAQSEGGFVGGGQYPGVDCGGFVTNLVVNSGYDPNYNDKKGDTSVQRQWLEDNWTSVGVGGSPGLDEKLDNAGVAVAIYLPGNLGHTFIYIKGMVELAFGGEGTGGKPGIASASYGGGVNFPAWRAPMAGTESTLSPSFEWFVKK